MNIPTQQQLADMLARVNVREAAELAGVSEKTIYRYRWRKTFPTLDVLEKLAPLLEKARRASRKTGSPEASAAQEG